MSAEERPDLSTRPAVLEVDDLVLEYAVDGGSFLRVVDGVSFSVPKGGRLALVGPSGCGKTSILRALIGVLPVAAGAIRFGVLTPEEARTRRVFGFVPQSIALLPWRTAAANVSLPLELEHRARPVIEAKVAALLDLFGLDGFARYFPSQLSGGMRSRVAIARALVSDPPLLLLDECFGSLDSLTRESLYRELSPRWSTLGSAVVLVTHSIPEAIYLSDEVIVLSPRPARVVGRIAVAAAQPRDEGFFADPVFRTAEEEIRALLGL